MPDWLIPLANAGVVLALIVYIFKQSVAATVATNAKIDAHLEECGKIPKAVLLEKLDSLCEKQDAHHESATEQLNKVEKVLTAYADRTSKNEAEILKIHGKIDLLQVTKVDKGAIGAR